MPPKKKGGKKKRKAGAAKKNLMSPEEMQIFKEKQRLETANAEKIRVETLILTYKKAVQKEQQHTKFNLHKLNHQWRNIMREAKTKELKKEIEILSQSLERVIDRKDSVLKSLLKDLEESADQYMMAIQSHVQNVDRLLELQSGRVNTLQSEYDTELEMIRKEFDSEETYIISQNDKQVNEMEDILVALEQYFKEKDNDARTEFQNLRDEIRNKNNEENHALRVELEKNITHIWDHFTEALTNYNENTEERKRHYESLKLKDEKSSKEIEQQTKKLARIADNIGQLKAKINQTVKYYEDRNKTMKEQREAIALHFHELKNQMNKLRDLARERLTKMTLESHAAQKRMKMLQEKSERILKMAENCRKRETEEEKVLPFYVSSLTSDEQRDVEEALQQETEQSLSLTMHKYQGLERFWKRFNKVELDRLAMEKEKEILMKENVQLRTLLKQYLDGISVNDEILANQNSLVIVNGISNIIAPPLMKTVQVESSNNANNKMATYN